MLRFRDFLAALAVFVLAKLASEDPSESLEANVQLSYYVGREIGGSGEDAGDGQLNRLHRLALAPVTLDVDGDGTVEALASILHDHQSNTWKVEVMDLKPAASTDKTHLAPFHPKTLYQSEPIRFESGLTTVGGDRGKDNVPLMPLQLATGHVRLQDDKNGGSNDGRNAMTHYKNVELNDRNRHYFCGNDWHHASKECSMPCPEGTVSECPEGQHCYADTPCDIADLHRKQESKTHDGFSFSVNDLLVTPAGGLPSIFSVWSNGVIAMHSLTGDFPSDASARSIKRNKVKEMIGLRQMWESPILSKTDLVPYEWAEVSIHYIDATDAGAGSGMVVVQAHMTHYDKDEEDEAMEETIFMALDAETGKKLWDASLGDSEDEDKKDEVKLPLASSVQSTARRRSLKPLVKSKRSESMVSNCLHAYRRSIFASEGILPYLHWGESDATTYVSHFEQQEHNQHAIHSNKKSKKISGQGSSKEKSKWKQALSPFNRKRHSHHTQLKRGKPNVIVSKNENGIEVRSLKNGRSVCHLSLWYDTLYTDLNHDGVLDGVFVVTGDHVADNDDYERSEDGRWISKLVKRLKEAKMLSADSNHEEEEQQLEDQSHKLCHLMALSGVPAKEELFSVNLCGNHNLNDKNESPDPAPLLAVESAYGKGQDIVVALNDKTVQRLRGKNGRRVWQLNGKLHEDFPSWENGYNALFDRIDVSNIASAVRPIVLVGDSSIALISPGQGRVLATAALPQPSIRKPVLVDFNGDGTTDIVVLTKDAVWGYRVTVSAGSSIPFRITVGLLVLGIMLAMLKNRFGPHPGKRSTDA